MNLATINALHQEHGDELALVVNMSGGKDSVRMLGFLREHFPTVRTYVVMADTGFEHVKPVSAETWSRERAAAFGRRFSCRLCIFSTKADIHAIAKHDPEAIRLVANLEQKINFTMRAGESLPQILGQDLSDARQYGSEEAAPCM